MNDLNKYLSFDTLREANTARLPQFKNAKGLPAHSEPDGSDWIPAQWLQAVVGELGEYANIRKKFERGDITEAEFLTLAADELADTVTYLDILAFRLGIDLGAAIRHKFNRVSRRVGANVFIGKSMVYTYDIDAYIVKEAREPDPSEWCEICESGNCQHINGVSVP